MFDHIYFLSTRICIKGLDDKRSKLLEKIVEGSW